MGKVRNSTCMYAYAYMYIRNHAHATAPRSKISQDTGGGILDHGSWIRHDEIQYGLDMSIWPSLNPRSLPGAPWNLNSINVFQDFNVVLCPSWFCHHPHGSCDSLHVHVCYMCIAKQLEATASFTLQPFVSQSRYSAWFAISHSSDNSDASETLRFI